MKLFFQKVGKTVEIDMRAEGPGGMVGDARSICKPGQKRFGIPYADWSAMQAGVAEFDGAATTILESVKPRPKQRVVR